MMRLLRVQAYFLFQILLTVVSLREVVRLRRVVSLREVVRLRRVVSLCEVVRLRRVVSASPKLLLRSSHHFAQRATSPPAGTLLLATRATTSPNGRHHLPKGHHLPQGHYPRAACITYFSGYHICSYLSASFLRYLGMSLSHSWHFISSEYIRATQ